MVILVIGAALALSQFAKFERLATGILASSAVLGLVVGFAARQTLANLVAGILIAITQPIRIGDTVTIEDETGRVDDLTLSYTYIDPGDGRLVVVPNEKVVAERRLQPLDRRPHGAGDGLGVGAARRPTSSRPGGVLKPAGRRRGDRRRDDPRGGADRAHGPRDHERTQVGDEEARAARERPRGAARGGAPRQRVRRVADPAQVPFPVTRE